MGKQDAFFSYSTKDRKFAEDLLDALSEGGADVWYDEDRIRGGDVIPKVLRTGIETSERFFFLLSRHYLRSDYCRQELEFALKRWWNRKSKKPLLVLHQMKREDLRNSEAQLSTKALAFLKKSTRKGSDEELHFEDTSSGLEAVSCGLLKALRIGEPRQAAAVCYRQKPREKRKFLLVRDSTDKRWLFPKGKIKKRERAKGAAKRELREESGVEGLHRSDLGEYHHGGKSHRETKVHAFLFEFNSSDTPKEWWRKPDWFTKKKAIERLAENRRKAHARGLQVLIEQAAERTDERQARGRRE